jgi:isopenicillin N synthase-like dioxygenase
VRLRVFAGHIGRLNAIGYSGLAQQQLDPNAAPDLKESFYLSESTEQSGNQYPSEDDVPGFATVTSEYYDAMIRLSQRIFRMLAMALGMDEHIFDAYSGADGTVSSTHGSTLRLVHYPSTKGRIEDTQFSCGAHTDFGFCKSRSNTQMLVDC